MGNNSKKPDHTMEKRQWKRWSNKKRWNNKRQSGSKNFGKQNITEEIPKSIVMPVSPVLVKETKHNTVFQKFWLWLSKLFGTHKA